MRRSYRLLAALGLFFLLFDFLQRSVYVHQAPVISQFQSQGIKGALTRAVMVAGQGMDEVESATGLRDLAAAAEVLKEKVPGRLEILSLIPQQAGYSNDEVLQSIRSSQCEHLILYLTGHGGGLNFGAVGGLNIKRDALAEAVSSARFDRATIVIDCCWSGEFARSFTEREFPGPVTLVTSTDARHPSPFPVSFLSPHSYGRMYFDRWDQNPMRAFRETNQSRRTLTWMYSEEFGLEGELTVLD